ncbi:Thaumatin-like protein 1 [Hibiscus syriacus]|uniref:Thaumatin-like protein 1 n=1 Tax=Hibiscus syriacus TaxID=106335 RepID=A0A6A3BAH2_HIBSY|nr:Thaumatin-like protein 1 [Hibiscus syriacus]
MIYNYIHTMKLYSLFGLSFAILFSGAQMVTITVKNNCAFTIWPATLTGGGGAQLPNTGFELPSQEKEPIEVPATWTAGVIWARTQCSGSFTCATGDCGSGEVACNGAGPKPPATLAEFTLGANDGQDTFDVSLVNGFNLPVSIAPQGGSGPICTTTSCAADVNAVCPPDLVVPGSDGNTIACNSTCDVFGNPEFCCTGDFDSAETCEPSEFSMVFKEQCPQAYSYAFDDETSTFVCSGGPDYLVTFCP